MKFNAAISGFNVDAKKRTVKIALTTTSHVQLDELSSIAARDSVSVSLDPEPEITVMSFGAGEPTGDVEVKGDDDDRARELVKKGLGLDGVDDDVHTLGGEAAKPLSEAAAKLREEDGKGENQAETFWKRGDPWIQEMPKSSKKPVESNEDPGDRI